MICIAVVLLLSSCDKVIPVSPTVEKFKYTEYSFDWFDTATTVTGYAESQEEFDAVYAEISEMFTFYHRLYTIYNKYGDLNNMYTINTADGAVEVDVKIIDLIEYAKEMYYLTNGKTNIAMGSVLSLWHDARSYGTKHPENAKLPSMEKLQNAAEHTDIEDVIIDRENGTVMLADSEMSLDVGAIAKGYAVEMVAQYLEEKGITGYLLNVGGNVRAIGNKPDGSKWTVGIENPDAKGEEDAFLEYIGATSEAVVISGSYQRFYIVDGKSYHHIIDSETLMPSEMYRSVAVVCGNSALGDALSTALFCMSFEEGKALIESIDGVEAMWLTNSGEKMHSSGFNNYIVK